METLNKLIISEELIQILDEIKEKQEIAKDILSITILKEDVDCNYLSTSTDVTGNISYLTQSKLSKLQEEDYWNSKYRFTVKPSKLVEKLLKGVYTDHQKQEFSIAIKNALLAKIEENNDEYKIVFVTGEDIRKYYLADNYSNDEYESKFSGSGLFTSCMRYNKCQKYFDIYVKNPSSVSMAVIFDKSNRIKMRAIIWKTKKQTYYDRVYSINDKIIKFTQYKLDKLGYINISHSNPIKPTRDLDVIINLEAADFDYYPYMDTLCHVDTSNKTLHSDSTNNTDDILDNYSGGENTTDEEYHDDDDDNENSDRTCISCDNEYSMDDMNILGNRSSESDEYCCSNCSVYSERDGDYYKESECQDVEGSGWVLEDDCTALYNGEYCLSENSIELYDGEHANLNDDNLQIDADDNYFILDEQESDFVLINDKYYNINDYVIIEHNGKNYLDGDEELLELIKEEEEEIKEIV